MEEIMEFGSDFVQQTLDWASSVPDGQPSERLDFLKRFLGLCTEDELRRLKKMVQITRRRNKKDEKKNNSTTKTLSSDTPRSAVASPSGAVSPLLGAEAKEPWWNKYSDDDIITLDIEMVTKPKYSPNKKYQQHVATVDIVNTKKEAIYSSKVYHEPGSFMDHQIFRQITGFNSQSFADKSLPSENKVKEEVASILKNKLVITVGGESDFRALGLEMADFDHFNLQSHFYVEKWNEHGVMVREGHSLRSLSHFFLSTGQGVMHESLRDATMTMELFEVYKIRKLEDDPLNIDSRFNKSCIYNSIPVIPNPLSKKKK